MPARRSFWTISVREARGHAFILCAVLWVVAAIDLGWPGDRNPLGQLKFPDFVHFYVQGDQASRGRFDELYDAEAQHARQAELVPASASDWFLPVYGPQTALLFLVFARLPYLAAAFAWAGLTVVVYGLVVWRAWGRTKPRIVDGWFIAAAAAAFPPFWSLVLHGQNTVVPLAAFALAWMALERGHRFAAGLALGLLTIKPQFGLVLALVTLLCREWALIFGAVTSALVQVTIVVLVMGRAVLASYWQAVARISDIAGQLEPRPYQMHSVRALTKLLPGPFDTVVYLTLVLSIGWYSSRAWRSRLPLGPRLGAVVLASVLVNPHLTVYDAAVLALPILWVGRWVVENGSDELRARFWPLVYGLFVFLLLPTALLVGVQFSVVVQGALFWLLVREFRRGAYL